MTMVQVIDDPDVFDALRLQGFGHGEGILWLPTPAAVVVDAHLASIRCCGFTDQLEACDFFSDSVFLICLVFDRHGTTCTTDPKLWMYPVPLEEFQRSGCLLIHRTREPPAQEFDVMLFECVELIIPLWNVLLTVIVDELC